MNKLKYKGTQNESWNITADLLKQQLASLTEDDLTLQIGRNNKIMESLKDKDDSTKEKVNGQNLKRAQS